MSVSPWLVAAWLFGIGLYGIVSSRNFVHLIGCLSVCQSSTYVLLLSVGYRWGAGAPIFYDHPPGTPAVDPVIKALVLTDIVVGATITGIAIGNDIAGRPQICRARPAEVAPTGRQSTPVNFALNLVPLAVALPLAVAAAMLAVAHLLPARVPDVLATLTALTVAGICGFLVVESERHGVLTYWFGGWTPRPGVVLGVAFGVDPASASIVSFIGLLFAAALVFAWG